MHMEPDSILPKDPIQDSDKKVVVLIEDEPDLSWALSTALQHRGYETVTSTNGLNGLIKSRHHRPDCILLDLALPRMHGTDVLAKLRLEAELAEVPVIVITGSPDPAISGMVGSEGVAAVLRKPIRHEELLSLVDQVTGATRAN